MKNVNRHVQSLIRDLFACFLVGDHELGIQLETRQAGNVLYITDHKKRKFRMTIELDEVKA
jgi:hypothetical protein